MDRQGKLYQDEMTVEKYREDLKKSKMPYMAKSEARAINNRRARALALGECGLKIMDKVRECSKGHRLIEGTLEYMMNEAVEYPVAGSREKTFIYTVMFQVYADEPRYTPEEIEKECEDLTFRLRMETDEMYPEGEAEDDGSGESSNLEGEESGEA